jgi:ribose-phosphate pyrophosphokinase
VFSTASGRYFAERIAALLECPLGEVVRKQFGDGEQYYRINITDRLQLVGVDAIYVSPTASDSDLMELYRVGCELAALGTRRRVFVIPYLGYSTMERAVLPGEIVSAKMNARLLSAIPNSGIGNIFLLCDLHVAGLLQYFEGQAQRMELYAERFLTEAITRAIDFSKGDVMFGSADLGRPLWVESFAKKFGTGIAFIRKTRRFETTQVIGMPIGEVAGMRVIIYDDMTRSAITLINAA